MPSREPKPIKLGEEPEIEIKVMPEQFYFKKVKIPKEGGPKSKMALIVAMIVIVLGLMAAAAYLFIQSLEKGKTKPLPTPVVTPTPTANVLPTNAPPVNVLPTNAPPVNVPPSPVCGNGICETGESSADCPADCPAPPPPPPTPPAVLPLAQDTDNDGLTDVEEGLFTTDFVNSDSDTDGYRDGLEVINLYNPAGFAPHKIEETALVKIYSNPTFNYTIFYPASWLAQALDETNREVMFTSATGEFIQVIAEDNPERLPLMDWYLAKSPGVSPAEVGTATTKRDGVLGIKSPDGLTVYFGAGDKIFAISYNVGVKTELNYKSTFEMMYKSFKL